MVNNRKVSKTTASRKKGVYGSEIKAYDAGYKRGYKSAKAGY